MNDELLRALFAWCIENHLPEIFAALIRNEPKVCYRWSRPDLEVWIDPDEWLLNVSYSWEVADYDCNCMATDSTGYTVKIESVDQLHAALRGAFSP